MTMLQTNTILHTNTDIQTTPSQVKYIETADEICASLELLKVIHQCNQKQGWTLLIAPENVPNKAMLASCSIDSSKLLVIRQKHIVNLEYVLNAALNNGNFSAVITWTNITSKAQLESMQLNTAKASLYCFTEQAEQKHVQCFN